MKSPFQRLEEVFNAVVEAEPGERAALLERLCEGDASLREQVIRMLAEHDVVTTGVLATPLMPDLDAAMPTRIGPFQIVGVLGEGGMGQVFEARQETPQRSVAIKVIRDGMGSREGERRFAREAELLAQFNHPGIAQIYASGTAVDDQGRQRRYIAMELVRGKPLLAFARDADLSIAQRIELLARVCDAVQHAHQRGVIHRDLKSANILIEPLADDPVGRPKVLDFGVARLHDESAQQMSMATEPGRIIGTLAYMSPEQVIGDPRLIDTRTDVYSLGVLGFELISGVAPLAVAEKSLPEAARIIRDEQPTRLGQLVPACRGEIETIISKATEKEVERRYAGAGEFSADLRRVLRHEPILARPPTTLYQLRKLAQRNRAIVAAGALALLALVGGLAGTLVALARAEASAERQRQVARVLTEVFAGINPESSRGRDVSVLRETLESVESRLSVELKDQPATEAELRAVLGDAYRNLWKQDRAEAMYSRAIELIERTEGRDSPALPALLNRIGLVQYDQDRFDDAETSLRRARAILSRRPGSDQEQDIIATTRLGDVLQAKSEFEKAEAVFRDAAERAKALRGEESTLYTTALNSLGNAVDQQGRYQEADGIMRRAIELGTKVNGEVHPETAMMIDNLSGILTREKNAVEAEAFARKGLDLHRRLVPGDSIPTASSLSRLANAEVDLGNIDEAIKLEIEALEMNKRVSGTVHRSVASSYANLGQFLSTAGRNDEAVEMGQKALEIDRQIFKPVSYEVLADLLTITRGLRRGNRLVEGEPLAREAIKIACELLPEEHPTRQLAEVNCGLMLSEIVWTKAPDAPGLLELADQTRTGLQRVLPRVAAKRGDNDPVVHRVRVAIASCGTFRARTLQSSGAPAAQVVPLLEADLPTCETAREALFDDKVPMPDDTKAAFRREVGLELGRLHEVWALAVPGTGHEAESKHWFEVADSFLPPSAPAR